MSNASRERAVELALYIIENNATVRSAGAAFSVSKSTVFTDVTKKLRRIDPRLWVLVRAVLQNNKRERHLRGGAATREKYRSIKKRRA